MEKVTLTLRDMGSELVDEAKNEAKQLNMSVAKFVECLISLHLLRTNFSKEQILGYWKQKDPVGFKKHAIASKL